MFKRAVLRGFPFTNDISSYCIHIRAVLLGTYEQCFLVDPVRVVDYEYQKQPIIVENRKLKNTFFSLSENKGKEI